MNNTAAIRWVVIFLLFGCPNTVHAQQGELLISFRHMANNKPVVLRDSLYENAFNERYALTRLRYYVSNVYLGAQPAAMNTENVYLVDAGEADTLRIKVPVGAYTDFSFTLGVDSLLNCSGAQSGPLDPLKGMFWTWNTGYIFFKMEGFSPASNADLNRIEHHIGGYRGPNKAQRNISLSLAQPIVIEKNTPQRIILQLNLDQYWQSVNGVVISEEPVIMSPGLPAKKIADNFPRMFSIVSVQ